MIPVSVKYYLYLIAVSLATVFTCSAAERKTQVGVNLENLLGVSYKALAGKQQTEGRQAASCVSAMVYGLRSLGYNCSYTGFRKYYRTMRKSAVTLEPGRTVFPHGGAIIFNHEHFSVLYSDVNSNNIIDANDRIIHALFEPVQVTRISTWLDKNPGELLYLPIDGALPCPRHQQGYP